MKRTLPALGIASLMIGFAFYTVFGPAVDAAVRTQTFSQLGNPFTDEIAIEAPAARRMEIVTYDELPADHDCAIALAATHRLALNAAMASHPVHVKCHGGVVTLRGHVPVGYLCALAENTVRQVAGVIDVRNDLTTGGPDVAGASGLRTWDVELAEKKLNYDLAVVYQLKGGDIEVEAARHAWCLRGNLESEEAVAWATEAARKLHPGGKIVSALSSNT